MIDRSLALRFIYLFLPSDYITITDLGPSPRKRPYPLQKRTEHSFSSKVMIVILSFVYFLSRNTRSINAAPMEFSRLGGDLLISQSSREACVDQRSIWDIIWSCLATIFACCWVSVHPNMPALTDGKWKIACHRLELMFWAVIAPEMIIMWALRQWYGARELADTYEGPWCPRNFTF